MGGFSTLYCLLTGGMGVDCYESEFDLVQHAMIVWRVPPAKLTSHNQAIYHIICDIINVSV